MTNQFSWSKTEKQIARKAFDAALEREYQALAADVKTMADTLAANPREVWQLRDYIDKRGKDFDNKYDFRFSQMIPTFGILLRQGWLKKEDLMGLADDKLARIEQIAGFLRED